MGITVSISDFRDNLTDYLELLQGGKAVVIKDARKDKAMVELISTGAAGFDWDSYIKDVKKLAGSGLFAGDEADRRRFRRNFDNRLRDAINC